MTLEQINQMKLAALHCDDYSQYCREMREIERLKAKHGFSRASVQGARPKAVRRSTGRRTATSVSHAIAMMEGRA